jgi:hypothetical protein
VLIVGERSISTGIEGQLRIDCINVLVQTLFEHLFAQSA